MWMRSNSGSLWTKVLLTDWKPKERDDGVLAGNVEQLSWFLGRTEGEGGVWEEKVAGEERERERQIEASGAMPGIV